MTRSLPALAALLVLTALTPAPAGAVDADVAPAVETPAGGATHPVAAELVTDAVAIVPGRPFDVGVRLRIEPGWHVYWKNPGDAGLATLIELNVPDGFEVGPIEWPLPVRFGQPPDLVGYGYADSVALLAEVTPPATLRPGERVSIGATADWLCCRTVCIPGRAELTTELPVAAPARPTAGGGGHGALTHWRDRLPSDPGRDGDDARYSSVVTGAPGPDGSVRFHVDLTWNGAPPGQVEWFPAAGETMLVDDVSVTTGGGHTRIGFELRLIGPDRRDDALESLVVYEDENGRRRGTTLIIPTGNEPTSVHINDVHDAHEGKEQF